MPNHCNDVILEFFYFLECKDNLPLNYTKLSPEGLFVCLF